MTWRFGHRGACGHAPENTIASMEKALAFGVDGFEFDIQLSKDGVPVVIHDETLERTTSGRGLVADHTLAELQRFDAGDGERIPTLEQVIAFVDRRCTLLVELKAPLSTGPVVEVLARSGWDEELLSVCSFDHTQILEAKRLNPKLRTCALLVGIPVTYAQIAEEAGAWAINPNIHHMNAQLVADARRRGLKVIAWTANTPEQIAKARALGVDGIVSDFPDRL